jgi:hypothetical protein
VARSPHGSNASEADQSAATFLSSRPGDFHPQALPKPCMNLSIHTAPDVRPLPWHSTQCTNRCRFVRLGLLLGPAWRLVAKLRLRRLFTGKTRSSEWRSCKPE